MFKLAFGTKVPRALVGQEYSLSLLTYGNGEGKEPEPASDLPLDLVLYGAGSIGTGFGHALVLAPQFAGPVAIVDNGVFDEKNPYKYSLLDWATDALTPEERHQLYKMLRLKVVAYPDQSLEVSGALLGGGGDGGGSPGGVAPSGGLGALGQTQTSSRRRQASIFGETNDNSVAILLSYGTARVLLAGDSQAREEEYMAGGHCTRP